jgi:hypothetical protein
MTVVCHHCDLDDELGFSVNTLTRAAKLFGGTVNSKVPGGNSTGVHLCTHGFVKHDKDRKTLGTDQVRFLPFADSKEREPNEPTDFSGWVRWQKKSHAVVDKTSPLLAGIRALPSFQDCATTPGSLNDTDHKIAELQKKIKKKVGSPPSRDAADANVAADTACAAAPTATTEDPSSQDAVDANVAAHAAAATTEDPSSHKAANIARPATAAVALTSTKDPPSQDNDWSGLDEVLEGGEDTVSRLADHQKQ